MTRFLIAPFLLSLIAHAATVDVPIDSDVQAVVDANPPGTIFQFAAGTYHGARVLARDGDQFIGALDEFGNRLTILSGAEQLTSFTQDAYGNYVADTTQTVPGQQVGYCTSLYPRCTFPEDFFYDDQPYVHMDVGGEALRPGQYYFDYPEGRIYFKPRDPGDDPAQHKVEYSRIRSAIWGSVANVVVRNLIVEKYAVPAQFGAIGDQYPGEKWLIQNTETRFNHGQGLRVSSYSRILNNFTHNNGQMGMGGDGDDILVEGNEIAYNNYTGSDHDFECGGFKFAKGSGLVVRSNYSHHNLGPGMWTDISSIHSLYEDNLVMYNSRSGIFHETSYDAIIRNNTIMENGSFGPDDWFWNAQIQIAASQNVEVYGNTIVINSLNNGNGIMLIQQNRTNEPCSYGPCRVINNSVHDNFIIVTGDRSHGTNGVAQDFTGDGDISDPASNNRFFRNQYYVTDLNSQVYWYWGGWYRSFAEFRGYGQDTTGTLNPNFTPAPSLR